MSVNETWYEVRNTEGDLVSRWGDAPESAHEQADTLNRTPNAVGKPFVVVRCARTEETVDSPYKELPTTVYIARSFDRKEIASRVEMYDVWRHDQTDVYRGTVTWEGPL